MPLLQLVFLMLYVDNRDDSNPPNPIPHQDIAAPVSKHTLSPRALPCPNPTSLCPPALPKSHLPVSSCPDP